MSLRLREKKLFEYVNWWSITFLLLCSTKFLVVSSLPTQENNEILKHLESNEQDSVDDLQESNDRQELKNGLQELDDNFEIQPRVIFL